MMSDSGSGNMARAKEKQPTSSTPAAATTIVSDLASLCAAGLLCSCQDVDDGSPCCSCVAVSTSSVPEVPCSQVDVLDGI